MPWKPYALLLMGCTVGLPQDTALPSREKLSYNIEWRLITAGKALLEWSAGPTTGTDARTGWEVRLHLESVGLVSKLYKVDDNYASMMDHGLCVQSTLT